MTTRRNPNTARPADAPKTGRAAAWDAHERAAILGLYWSMRAAHEDGRLNKAEMIRAVRGVSKPTDTPRPELAPIAGKLAARSSGSIEAKLMNVSACLRTIIDTDDRADVVRAAISISMADKGYKAFGNIQKALADDTRAALVHSLNFTA